MDDPRRKHRLIVGLTASTLMTLSVLFTGAVYGLADGSHSAFLRAAHRYGVRELLIAVIGLGAVWFILRPERIDARVAQSAMLAAAIVAVAVGATLFGGAVQARGTAGIAAAWPGAQTWMLIVSGILFLYLRWRRDVWPESRWAAELMNARSRRR